MGFFDIFKKKKDKISNKGKEKVKSATVNNEPLTIEQSVVHFEKKYGLVLPEDYKNFLKTHNVYITKENTSVFVDSLNVELEIDSLFGFDESRDWLDINYWMDQYQDELPEGSVIIGCDIMKGFFIIMGNGSGIYYWDDSMNFDKSTPESNAYYVCSNFTEFAKLIGV